MPNTVMTSTAINRMPGEHRRNPRTEVTPILSALQIEQARLRALMTRHVIAPDVPTEHLDGESNDVISSLAQLAVGSKLAPEVSYVPLPAHARGVESAISSGTWRIALHGLKGNPLTIELLGDVILGRGPDADVDFEPYNGYALAVSRRHAMLRPSRHHLHLMDLGSTNGTMCNTIPLGRCVTYQLKDQDVISLGLLLITILIVDSPTL